MAKYLEDIRVLGGTVSIGSLTSSNTDNLFEVNGDSAVYGSFSTTGLKITNGASSGYILQSDASGNATWTAPVVATFGSFGIANSNGEYTYYSTITSALSGANSGQTVEFFSDYEESGNVEVVLVDGVNINMNGHTYKITYTAGSLDGFIAAGVTCSFQNGTIIIDIGSSTSFPVYGLVVVNSSIDATGLVIKVESSSGYGVPVGCGDNAILKNISAYSIDYYAISVNANNANLYNCYGECFGTWPVIQLGRITGGSVFRPWSYATNCTFIGINESAMEIGYNGIAINCFAKGSPTSTSAVTLLGGKMIGGYVISETGRAIQASGYNHFLNLPEPYDQRGWKISGVELVSYATSSNVVNLSGGFGDSIGIFENCNVIAATAGNGIRINDTRTNRILISNCHIRLSSTASYAIYGSTFSQRCMYVNNIFSNTSTPVDTTTVIQDIINTPDSQGNIII